MDEDVQNLGINLTIYFENKNYSSAEDLIGHLQKQFSEGQLPSTIIDFHLLNIFNKKNGLISFMEKILNVDEFKGSLSNSLTLLTIIVNNLSNRIKKYVEDIINICKRVAFSRARPESKVAAMEIMEIVIKKRIADNANIANLYRSLFENFDVRKAAKVESQLAVVLGIIAKYFPYLISEKCLIDKFLARIESELYECQKYPNRTLKSTEGCLIGLSYVLENFGSSLEQETRKKLVQSIEKLISDPKNTRIKIAFRAALNLLKNHSALFSNELYVQYKTWYGHFLKWLEQEGAEDKKAGYYTCLAFFQEMGNTTYEQDNGKDAVKFFINNCMSTILKPEEPYKLHLSIRGIGFFAKALYKHLPEQFERVFAFVSQKMEEQFFLQENESDNNLEYLPDYILAVINLAGHLKNLTDLQMALVNKSSVFMIKTYPQLPSNYDYLVINALITTICNLKETNEKILDNFLREVLYQGILWTCSHEIAADAEVLKDEVEIISYKNYLPLWNGLLTNIEQNRNIDRDKAKALQKSIFEELMKNLFVLINKLDVSAKMRESDVITTDLEKAFEPVKVADTKIFVNVVDLYQDIFVTIEKTDVTLFQKWIPTFVDNVIKKSRQYPLCSGFYKLLSSCLKLAKTLNYFTEERLRKFDYVKVTYESIYNLVQEVLKKINIYKEDLQISCLNLLMAIPVPMVRNILPLATSAFISLIYIGRSFLTLTHKAIDTLEEWYKFIPKEDMKPFLEKVVPELDSYLQSHSLNQRSVVDSSIFQTRKTNKVATKRKVFIESESELLELQQKILVFVGKLDTDICYKFVGSKTKVEPAVWGKTSLLKVTLPFEDAKIAFPLEKFVPRLLDLALYSSNRKTRITACELLHAVALNLLGFSKTATDNELKDSNVILKKMMLPLLQLACDVDSVVQDIFKPFILQLMHWYSHSTQREGYQADVVRDSLLEAITNASNPALRDFAGDCIKEYIIWTKRQTKNPKKHPIDIEFWVNKIIRLSRHPDQFKRMGSVLLFNSIYTEVREESNFCSYWLLILEALVTNLSLLDKHALLDDNLVMQIYLALDHIQRGLVEKNIRFNDNNPNRTAPLSFNGNSLQHAVTWILKQTGSLSINCRKKCMSMFCKIAPFVKGCKNIEDFVHLYLKNEPQWLIHTYNLMMLDPNNLKACKSMEDVLKWFYQLLCALDGYTFIINNNILPPQETFINENIFEAVNFCLENVLGKSLVDVLTLVPKLESIYCTSSEKERFKMLKVQVVDSIIEFVIMVLKRDCALYCNHFWQANLWIMIRNCIFQPHLIGIETTKVEALHSKITQLLSVVNNFLAPEHVNSLTEILQTYIRQNYKHAINIRATYVPYSEKSTLKGMMLLQKTCLEYKINISSFVKNTVMDLFKSTIVTLDNPVFIKLNRSVKEYYELKLQLALEDENEVNLLFECLASEIMVINESSNKFTKQGQCFFETFKEPLAKIVVYRFSDLIDRISNQTSKDIYYFCLEILTYAFKNKNNIGNTILRSIIHKISEKWDTLSEYFSSDLNSKMRGIDFVNKMMKLTEVPRLIGQNNDMKSWIVELLQFENQSWNIGQALDFKGLIIELLPCISGPDDDIQEDLLSALSQMQNKYFKEKSSMAKLAIPIIIRKIFECLKFSKSITVLSFCMDVYIMESEYVKEIPLEQIIKYFIRGQSLQGQLKTLNFVWTTCLHEKYLNKDRYILIRDLFTLLLRKSFYQVFENFCKGILDEVKKVLENKDDPLYFSPNNMVNRTIFYILVELVFSRLDVDKMENDKRKIVQEFTKIAVNVCKEDIPEADDEIKEIFRLYQCHCYNALVSLIANTQDNIQFYRLLFSREKNGENICWNKLVDLSKKYEFTIDFDKIPKRKKKLTSIRSKLKENEQKVSSYKYLQSQRLFESTLSEDFSKYDFTHSILKTNSETQNENNENNTPVDSNIIFLDSLELNEHECMATICNLIKHMVESNISPLPEEEKEIVLPDWMNSLRKTLISEATHMNVKIFLVKVIENVQIIFKPFAKWFLEPIMKLIVDECLGSSINYFVADLVMVLISWSPVAKPIENQELASHLLMFLMQNINTSRKALMKEDLNLIKLVIENWKSCVKIPHNLLLQKSKVLDDRTSLAVGIHLTAICLINGFTPWDQTANVSLETFMSTFVKILKNNYQDVYLPCAETIGIILKYLQDNDYNNLNCAEEIIASELRHQNNSSHMPQILSKICLNYPPIVDNFFDLYLNKINQELSPLFKKETLKMILARPEAAAATYGFRLIDFERLLTSSDLELQALSLEVIEKLFDKIKPEKHSGIIRKASQFVYSSNVRCRSCMYQLFMRAYRFYSKNNLLSDLLRICREVLLKGLVDSNADLQSKAYVFWNSDEEKGTLTDRFLYLFSSLYHPGEMEEHFLGYCSVLILNLTRNKEEFGKKLFDYQLESCFYENYQLQNRWRAQHTSFTPLFASSLRSQETQSSQTMTNPYMLKATQNNFTFLPTQIVQQDVQKEQSLKSYSSSFSIPLSFDRSYSESSIINDQQKYDPLKSNTIRKRRLCNDKVVLSKVFKTYEVKKQEKVLELRKDIVKQQEKNVSIYRTYRKGDFPDIQITLSEIVAPLEALSKSDSYIARLVFSSVLNNFVKIKDDKLVISKFLSSKVNDILCQSSSFVPNLIGTFLEFAITNKDLVQLNPETVALACQSSSLYSVGSLLIEEYLINLDLTSSSPKRRSGEESIENHYWIKLAELYREMEEWDTVTAIFLEKINCNENVLEAVARESNAQWMEAANLYKKAIEEETFPQRQVFYYESCFKCFANLGKWEDLSNSIKNFIVDNDTSAENISVDVWQSLWTNENYQQKVLPWYIKAEVLKKLEDSESDIISYLNESLKDPCQSNYLKTRFGEEMAMLFISTGETDTAKQYIYNHFNYFLGNWANINPLFVQLKANKLIGLKNVVDIDYFLKRTEKMSIINYQKCIDDIILHWDKSKESGYSVMLNETKLLYRDKFIDMLVSNIQNIVMDEEEQDLMINKLEDFRYKLHLNFIDLALQLNNPEVTLKYFRRNLSKKDKKDINWYLPSVTFACIKIKLSKDEEKVVKYINVWKNLADSLNLTNKDSNSSEIIRSEELIFNISKDLASVFNHNFTFMKYKGDLAKLLKTDNIRDPQDVINASLSDFSGTLNYYYSKCQKQETDKAVETVREAFTKLAYYYQNHEEYITNFIQAVLRAMKLGSFEGRQLFPCLLSIPNLGYHYRTAFIEESADIPIWMFLGWIPQILAILDTTAVFALKEIVLKIANTYPCAIKYAYRLSKKKYIFRVADVKIEGERLLQQLDELLLGEVIVDKLLTALSYVALPEVILNNHLKLLWKLKDKDALKQGLQNLIEDVYPLNKIFESTSIQGRIYDYIKVYKEKFASIIKANQLEKCFLQLKEIEGNISNLNSVKKIKKSLCLSDFCPWLDNFKPDDNNEIEIPGQYEGNKRPLPQFHAKIVGFSSDVRVMPSLRKPIKISILGHDAKEYPFLIKRGEDLRQDQRIEQLFCLMNSVLTSDPDCKQKQLSIQTYGIIPLTDSLGIIQWVDQTKPLNDFIKEAFDKKNKICEKLKDKYNEWISATTRENNISKQYGLAASQYTRDKTITRFKNLASEVPWDCLRQAFWNISIDPESFFALRHSFAISYATMCISHWILGIGDRHLGNTLMSLENGQAIGIDFGHAFGTGVQLPIPELIPFRLTPHLVNLLKPLDYHGLLQETMVHCLGAFRRKKEVLLATMDVFIKEPSLEWLQYAKNSRNMNSDQKWFPEQKILLCRQKLEGANPIKIMEEELLAANPAFCSAYINLVKGDPNYNKRLYDHNNLTTREQVIYLIDQATDENILGRQWVGLETWI